MDSVGIPWNSDIPVGIQWIPLELMGESKDLPVSCARPLHYLILVEFAYPQSLSTIMYANEPSVSKA